MTAREAIVGREPELARLDAALARARAGTPVVVLVTGEAGMGKSQLVAAVGERTDALVVAVACDPAEADLDYGVVEQVLRAAPLDPTWVDGVVPGPGTGPLDAGATLLAALDDLPLEQGVVVVVDDAQWADAASLDALTFVARRLRAEPMALCVTCRTAAVDTLPTGLVRLAADAGALIELAPLGPDTVGELAARHVGEALPAPAVERLHAHTGGSPLHVAGLARELGVAGLTVAGDLPAPRSYARLVITRLASCGPEARQVVTALAVLGLTAPLAVVSAVAGVDDPLVALDEAVAAGLVRVVDEPGARSLTVAHPLVRAAVLEDLPPSRVAAIHRAAGAVLDGPAGLRHRIAGSAGPAPALAAEARAVAAGLADRGAHGAAGRLLLDASRIDAAGAARDVPTAVDQFLLAGDLAAATALRDRVASLPPGSRRDFVLGHLAYVVGPRRTAVGHLEAAWAARPVAGAGDEDDHELAGRIAGLLATIAVDRSDGSGARTWATRARALAPARAADGHVGHMLAMSHALEGTIAAGIDELTEALAGGAPGGAVAVDLHLGRGVLRLWAHDLAGAADDLAACLAAGAPGTLVARETARYQLAELHYRAGRWDAAAVGAEVAASVADAGDQTWIAAFPHAVAASVLAGRGEWERAEAHLAAASRSATATAGGAARVWVALAAARLAEARGNAAAVVASVDALAAGRRRFDEGIVPWRAPYVEALVDLGRLDDAADALAWLAEDASTTASPLVRAELARAEATVALAVGDLDGGAGAVARGLAVASGAGPYPRARLELVAGRLWRAGGDLERAVATLGDADRRFAALGAAPWERRVEAELTAAGRRPRRRTATAAALTPHEAAVVHVVAEGRTNREAAAALYLSVKTVEHHLSRAYAKLGVRSRADLARLVREGRVGDVGAGPDAAPVPAAGSTADGPRAVAS